VPPAAVSRLLARYSRDELAGFVAVAIDLLDAADGDPDLELNGDELDGMGAEDDFGVQRAPLHLEGPGCPLADPDMAADDQGCDDIDQDLEPEECPEEFSDPAVRARHRRRIQRTRCIRRYRIRRHSLTGEIMSREVARYELDEWRVPSLTRRSLLKRKRGVPRRPRP